MVIKKKKIQKQKGGLSLDSLIIPKKLEKYFHRVFTLLNLCNEFLTKTEQHYYYEIISNYINEIISESSITQENYLLINLLTKLKSVFTNRRNNITNRRIIKHINVLILSDILCDFMSDISLHKLFSVEDKIIKLYIDILFHKYIISDREIREIFLKSINLIDLIGLNNQIKENLLIKYDVFTINNSENMTSFIDQVYRMNIQRIRICMIFNPRLTGKTPVFYGNIFDSSMGYNQFICLKVGVFSSEKRKYTINLVGEFIYNIMENYNLLNTESTNPLYKLLAKILRFNYKPGNKGERSDFNGLPQLNYLRNGTKFCIVRNQQNTESVAESGCSKKGFGCSLKMTAEIRNENIAPDEDILSLLDILLNIFLSKINIPFTNNRLSPPSAVIKSNIPFTNNRLFPPSAVIKSNIPFTAVIKSNIPFTNEDNREARAILRKKFNIKNMSEIGKIRNMISKMNKIKMNPKIRLTVNNELYNALKKRLYKLENDYRHKQSDSLFNN